MNCRFDVRRGAARRPKVALRAARSRLLALPSFALAGALGLSAARARAEPRTALSASVDAESERGPLNVEKPDESRAPADESLHRARDAFLEGLALAKRHEFAAAIGAFRRSEREKPHPVTTYNIGYCEQGLGHPASAFRSFSRALGRGGAGPSGAALPPAYEQQARVWLAQTESALVVLRVRLEPSRAAQVVMQVDGRSLERLATAPSFAPGTVAYSVASEDAPFASPGALSEAFIVLLDPGEHRAVVFDARGTPVLDRPIVAPANTTVELSLLPPETTAAAGAPEAAAPLQPLAASKADAPLVRGTASQTGTVPYAAYVALGVGAAGLATSAVFLGLTLHEESKLDPQCSSDNRCPYALKGERDTLRRYGDYTTASLGVGLVGAAVGTYLWFSASPRSRQEPRTAMEILPWFGPNGIGATGRF